MYVCMLGSYFIFNSYIHNELKDAIAQYALRFDIISIMTLFNSQTSFKLKVRYLLLLF